MRLKARPVAPVRLPELKLKAWPSPKAPPGVLAGRRIEDPVGLNPLDDVVVTGQQHALPASSPPGLLESERAEPRDLPVYDGSELVDHDSLGLLADDSGQVGTKSLAVREDGVRPQPGGHGAEPN